MRSKLISLAAALMMAAAPLAAEDLVILTTNDTHSNIDPDANGVGGVLPRMAIIDSVRKAEKNVLLVDAGDMVQGTLYFKYFKGDVEYPIFNMMKYDVRILGNHEFDNGLDQLAKYWKTVKGNRLSANYDFSATPAKGIFKPYVIKKIGGKKVGIMGINVNPESLISKENYTGMKYQDAIATANATAAELRRKDCDLVVAVTHIGYEESEGKASDIKLARESRDIDIIIGGHSHTFVDPATPDKTPYWIENAAGKPVLVTQTGKYGKNVGYIKIDLDNLAGKQYDYEYIPVTDRFSPSAYNKEIRAFLAPYKAKVDSVNARVIGYSAVDMENKREACPYANWSGDFGSWFGRHVIDSLRAEGRDLPDLDMAIMNVGGIRQPMKRGPVTEGQILSTFPFSNRMRIIRIKGADLLATMNIVAPKGGEAISGEAFVVMNDDKKVEHFLIGGSEVDPEREYVVATIDYIAEGNDDMTPMAHHTELWRDDREVCLRILDYIGWLTRTGLEINPDPRLRFVKAAKNL